MREIEITPEEYSLLRTLETRCYFTILSEEGLVQAFDDSAWMNGVRSILKDRAPPPDLIPSRIKVVAPKKPEPPKKK